MKQEDKRLEDLINKLMEADRLETTSFDFTDKVMSKVGALPNSSISVYKPLIPNYIWWLLASGFVALVAYLIFNKPTNTMSLSERYNLPEVSLNLLDGMSFDFSSTLMYATVLLAIMVSIQIPLLKQYFNNRLSY